MLAPPPSNATPLLEARPSDDASLPSARNLATALLTASLLGTGVLSMARACSLAGIVPFVLLSAMAAMTAHITGVFLAKSSKPGAESISALCREFFGPRMESFASVMIVLQQIGVCTGYVVVIGDTFAPLLVYWLHMPGLKEFEVRITLMVLVVLPLSLIRDLSGLRFTSTASVLAICMFCFTVIVNGLVVLSDATTKRDNLMPDHAALNGPYYIPQGSGSLRSLGLICFAYFMHQNVLAVNATLRKTTTDTSVYAQASARAVGLACFSCVSVGLMGYLSFLSETKPDILNNFSVKGTYISSTLNVVRAFYGTGLLLAFPMMLWEARANVFKLLVGGEHHDMPHRTHFFLTVGLVTLATTVGCVVKDLGLVFGLVGSTCSPIMAYVLPSLIYLKTGLAQTDGHETLAAVIAAVGSILVFVGIIVWALDVGGVWD